jgi:hypothetical protein
VDQDGLKEITEVEIKQLRRVLHDLSSVFTGILVSGGLLNMALEGDKRQRYSSEICEGAERGAAMIRQAREVLTAPEKRMKVPPATATGGEFSARQ